MKTGYNISDGKTQASIRYSIPMSKNKRCLYLSHPIGIDFLVVLSYSPR
jgi:hypothetical protein